MLSNYYDDLFQINKLTEAVVAHVNKRSYTLQSQTYKGKLITLSQAKTLLIDKIQVSAQYILYCDYDVVVAQRDQILCDGRYYEVLQVIPDSIKHHHLELQLKSASDLRIS